MIVHENNRDLYEKAINRMRRTHPCDILFTGDIIAMLEEEIDGYRNKIRYLEKELKEKTEEATLETEAAIEGIAVDDGIFHVSSGDTLILKTDKLIREEDARKIQEDIHKRTGLRVALFDGRTDIIGVAEHGT